MVSEMGMFRDNDIMLMYDMRDGIVCSYVQGRADFMIVDRSVMWSSTVIVRCKY